MVRALVLLAVAGAALGCAHSRGHDVEPAPGVGPSAARATRSIHAESAAPSIVRSTALGDLLALDVLDDSILSAMLRTAIARNNDLLLTRARIDEARALVGVASAARLPLVTVDGGVGTNRAVIGSAAVAYDAWRATAGASWEVDVWGRIRGGVDAATADLRGDEMAERAVIVSLVSDVAVTYLQLLELDEEYDIALRTYASRRTMVGLAQARYERGLVSELDVQQFKALAAVPRARLAQIAGERARREHALNVLLGESPNRKVSRGSLGDAVRPFVVPDTISATLVDARPDVAQAKRNYEASVARVGVFRAARLPPVSVGVVAGRQAPTFGTVARSQSDVYQLQLGVSVPVFTGGRTGGELSAAQARAEEARVAYERTKLNAQRAVADAVATLRSSRDEVEADEALRDGSRRALELSDLRYQGGIANLLEVLEPERALFDAELMLAQSRFRERASVVQLYEALGGRWVAG